MPLFSEQSKIIDVHWMTPPPPSHMLKGSEKGKKIKERLLKEKKLFLVQKFSSKLPDFIRFSYFSH